MNRLGLLAFALAFTASAAIELPLTIDRPTLVTPGEPASVSCTLGAGNTLQSSTCLFELKNGLTLSVDVDTLAVTDANTGDDLSEMYEGMAVDNGCGLTILAPVAEEQEWSCVLNMDVEGVAVYHKGTFQLRSSGFPTDIRLPKHVVPSHYNLTLIPILEEDNFRTEGSVSIDFKYDISLSQDDRDSQRIVLQTRGIAVDEATVIVGNGQSDPIIPIGHEYDIDREFYIIHLGRDLSPNYPDYSVSMTFTSGLEDDLHGLYRSSYVEEGVTKYLAVTQFEAPDARKAFPCLDEPSMKATFDVKVGRKTEMMAFSNMPSMKEEPLPDMEGYVLEYFETSAVMSTYLVAIMVADYSITDGIPVDGSETTFRVLHRRDRDGQADLAADIGPRILAHYNDYFNITFPLPKQDLAAIPDFDAGAMENWGLITYRETLLLFDEENSSPADKESVTLVNAHEISHQWFGDLVTMEWWTDLWLNEGFANYMQNIGIDFIDPTYQSMDRMVVNDVQYAFQIDALETTRAISGGVSNPNFDLFFGAIEYSKGSSLIRMMSNYLTEEVFKTGTTNYLNEFQYKNAALQNLLEAYDEAGHAGGVLQDDQSFVDIMTPWATNPGYPVVKVSNVVEDDMSTNITVSQERFLLDPSATSDIYWPIPLTISGPLGENLDRQLLQASSSGMQINFVPRPYIINYQEQGYYRVNYDLQNWLDLADQLATNPDKIDPLSRAQLYDDSFNLARVGKYLDYSIPLTLGKAVTMETHYVPLTAAITGLAHLDLMLRNDDYAYQYFQQYKRDLIQSNYERAEFTAPDNEAYLDALKRDEVISFTCFAKSKDCITKAKEQFAAWMGQADPDANNPIDPNLRTTIYEVAVMEGGADEFNFLVDRLGGLTVDAEKNKIIYGLGHSIDPDRIEQLLDMTITDEGYIRSQDATYVYRAVGSTDMGRNIQMRWLSENYEAIKEYFGLALFRTQVPEMLNGFSAGANLPRDIAELNAFLETHRADLGSAVSSIESDISLARINERWVEDNYVEVLQWLQAEVELPEEGPEGPGEPETEPQSDGASAVQGVNLFIALCSLLSFRNIVL